LPIKPTNRLDRSIADPASEILGGTRPRVVPNERNERIRLFDVAAGTALKPAEPAPLRHSRLTSRDSQFALESRLRIRRRPLDD